MTASASHCGPPAGFAAEATDEAFVNTVGPFFTRQEPNGAWRVGLLVDERHANHVGVAHGGLLASLADFTLGINIMRRAPPGTSFVTAHLKIDYVGAARIGEWLEASASIDKDSGRLQFVHGALVSGGRTVVTASAIFAKVEPR